MRERKKNHNILNFQCIFFFFFFFFFFFYMITCHPFQSQDLNTIHKEDQGIRCVMKRRKNIEDFSGNVNSMINRP